VWRSVDDCLASIDRALSDAESRAAIATAGQARTMAQHTYRHRAAEILGFVEKLRAVR
jgi:spore maturation protein CgeB